MTHITLPNNFVIKTIGRNRGILSRAGEHQQVTLTFATDKVDFYSTYLLIQNIDNPQDLKTIRISHEVWLSLPATVSRHSLLFSAPVSINQVVSQEKVLFGVLVDGKQVENPVIDLGDVYYDQVYRDHSFIILNQSDMALDFLVRIQPALIDYIPFLPLCHYPAYGCSNCEWSSWSGIFTFTNNS